MAKRRLLLAVHGPPHAKGHPVNTCMARCARVLALGVQPYDYSRFEEVSSTEFLRVYESSSRRDDESTQLLSCSSQGTVSSTTSLNSAARDIYNNNNNSERTAGHVHVCAKHLWA